MRTQSAYHRRVHIIFNILQDGTGLVWCKSYVSLIVRASVLITVCSNMQEVLWSVWGTQERCPVESLYIGDKTGVCSAVWTETPIFGVYWAVPLVWYFYEFALMEHGFSLALILVEVGRLTSCWARIWTHQISALNSAVVVDCFENALLLKCSAMVQSSLHAVLM